MRTRPAQTAWAAVFAALTASAPVAAAAGERPVALELVLAVDTSVSVDHAEFALQMAGLARAFRDPGVLAAIAGTGPEGMAGALVQWGVGLQQDVAVGWTRVNDRASAAAFARAIEASPRLFIGNGTAITRALWFARRQLDDNGFAGRRRVIDISGDGRNNSGGGPGAMRDRAVAEGITVNGLAILDGDAALGLYFATHVAGGPSSFVLTAKDFGDFAEAMRRKLLREISPPVARVPAGSTDEGGQFAFRGPVNLP